MFKIARINQLIKEDTIAYLCCYNYDHNNNNNSNNHNNNKLFVMLYKQNHVSQVWLSVTTHRFQLRSSRPEAKCGDDFFLTFLGQLLALSTYMNNNFGYSCRLFFFFLLPLIKDNASCKTASLPAVHQHFTPWHQREMPSIANKLWEAETRQQLCPKNRSVL